MAIPAEQVRHAIERFVTDAPQLAANDAAYMKQCASHLWPQRLELGRVFRSELFGNSVIALFNPQDLGLLVFPSEYLVLTESRHCFDLATILTRIVDLPRQGADPTVRNVKLLEAALLWLKCSRRSQLLSVAVLSNASDLKRAIEVELELKGCDVRETISLQQQVGMNFGVWLPDADTISSPLKGDWKMDISAPTVYETDSGLLLNLTVFSLESKPVFRYKITEYRFKYDEGEFALTGSRSLGECDFNASALRSYSYRLFPKN